MTDDQRVAYIFATRLPSNLRATTRDCVHLFTRGDRLRGKDSGHTIRSDAAENL